MANPIYDSMQVNPVQQLKSNPIQFLRSRGFNLPDGLDASNPTSIISSLMQSGQIGNGRYQQAMRMLNSMRRR